MLGETPNFIVHKHCIEAGHRYPDISHFEIISSNFRKNAFKNTCTYHKKVQGRFYILHIQ